MVMKRLTLYLVALAGLLLATRGATNGLSSRTLSAAAAGVATPFRFIAWGDTKSARSSLSALSDQATLLDPAFTIYAGDLEEAGFTQSGMDLWKQAMNGQLTGDTSPNGMFGLTLPVRGNHDSSNTSGWQAFFDLSQTAAGVGATHYTFMAGQEDRTYSFDFGNAHFIGVDVTGDAGLLTSAQIQWIDTDLAEAESRSLTHAFIYFHGPIYCIDGHCSCSQRVCSLPTAVKNLITMLNGHPILTATFHGHEHTYAYTFLDETRIPPDGSFVGVTHPFHQVVAGDAGAGPDSCNANRCDFNMAEHGFITVDVSGLDVVVAFYQQGSSSPVKTIAFSQSGGRVPIFADVPFTHPYNAEIESLYQAGYTAGCATDPLRYCPEQAMNRGESSVFVERGIHTASYNPPTPASQAFADLPLDSWAANWVYGLWDDHYTAGCGTNPLVYCPWQGHTRAEGCVFYLRMLHGADYLPPQPSQQVFADVPLDAWYAGWVQAAYDAGLLEPCQTAPGLLFCPNDPLTRALAAHMMVRAKGIPLP